MALVAGQKFRYHSDCGDLGVWEVLRVTACSAIVRPCNRIHKEGVSGKTGKPFAFDAPQGCVMISPNSSVVLVVLVEEEVTTE